MVFGDDQTKNVALHDDASTLAAPKPITTELDGIIRRLHVLAKIDGGTFNLGLFTPKLDFSVADTASNVSTDTSLLSVTAAGKIDFIGIDGSNSNYELILKVDTVEVYRLTMSQIGTTLGLSGSTGLQLPIWTETANKNCRYFPNVPVDFGTSFEVLVKATGNPTPTINFIITHRVTT